MSEKEKMRRFMIGVMAFIIIIDMIVGGITFSWPGVLIGFFVPLVLFFRPICRSWDYYRQPKEKRID